MAKVVYALAENFSAQREGAFAPGFRRTTTAIRRSLGSVWVDACGVKARQRCLRAGWECAAGAYRRDDLADRFGGEVRLIYRDEVIRLVGADEDRRGRQPRNLLLRV